MFSQEQLSKILFLDIETVPVAADFEDLSPELQYLWGKKATTIGRWDGTEVKAPELFKERAGIFAEFGKIVCISCGYLVFQEGRPSLKLKSFFGEDERQILQACQKTLDAVMSRPGWQICAHNGKEFDIPYMGRRYLIQQIPMPRAIAEVQSAKPWEVRIVDTMNLWKFGDVKSFTSLELLCGVLGVPTPKDDMDGSKVAPTYWIEKDCERIAKYCEQDVIATAQVLLRFSMLPLVDEADIHRQH